MNDAILILEPTEYNPEAIKIYGRLGRVLMNHENPLEFQAKESVSVLVCRLAYHLDENFLKCFVNLKYIVSPTTGLNHIDLKYCEDKKIRVISLKGETHFLDSIHSTSEHTMALMLALVRNIVPSIKSVLECRQWDRDTFKGRELASLTIGILGSGRIGRHIIAYAKLFGMNTLVCDPYIDKENRSQSGIAFCDQKELFEKSDVVTLHADYRPDNVEMITREDFERMRPGSYFINTARGELVAEDDLIWALEQGILAGAALDVLSNEQDMESLLEKKIIKYARNHPNLLITPHIGGCTSDAMHNTEKFIAEKLEKFIEV